jgi:hypothetical protein
MRTKQHMNFTNRTSCVFVAYSVIDLRANIQIATSKHTQGDTHTHTLDEKQKHDNKHESIYSL